MFDFRRFVPPSLRGMAVCALSALFFLLAGTSVASAQTAYAVTKTGTLFSFDVATPGTTTTIGALGFAAAGIDFNPADGQLYALQVGPVTSQLHIVDINTGKTTPVGSGFPSSGTMGANSYDLSVSEAFGFDFNPKTLQPDGSIRIRVTSDNGSNIRLNSETGSVAAVDGTLKEGAITVGIVGAAYTNNFAQLPTAGGTTTLYDLNNTADLLFIQNPPNNGTLNRLGSVGIDIKNPTGFDIFTGAGGNTNTAYIASDATQTTATAEFYRIDSIGSASITATLIGEIGRAVAGLAIQPLANAVPPTTFSINGRITNGQGEGVSGVRVTAFRQGASGEVAAGSGFTDASGNYAINNLQNGATYRVQARRSLTSFTPSERTVMVDGIETGVNFVAGFTLSGVVTLSSTSEPLRNIALTLTGPVSSVTVRTNSKGVYAFDNLAPGTYTIAPAAAETARFNFTPPSYTPTITIAGQSGLDFSAQPTAFIVSGTIRDGASNGVSGVSVQARNQAGTVVTTGTTNSAGQYVLPVPAGTYDIAPAPSRISYTPASYDDVVVNADVTGIDFTASFNVSGRVTAADGTTGLPNVPVFLVQNLQQLGQPGAPMTLTDASGNYLFPTVAPGTYAVAPYAGSGAYFVPSYRIVNVSPSSPVANFRMASTTDTAAPDINAAISPDTTANNATRTVSGTVSDTGSDGNPASGVAAAFLIVFKQEGLGEANARFYNFKTQTFEVIGTPYNPDNHAVPLSLVTDPDTGEISFRRALPKASTPSGDPLEDGLYFASVLAYDNALNRNRVDLPFTVDSSSTFSALPDEPSQ
jgi:hypothetical protein